MQTLYLYSIYFSAVLFLILLIFIWLLIANAYPLKLNTFTAKLSPSQINQALTESGAPGSAGGVVVLPGKPGKRYSIVSADLTFKKGPGITLSLGDDVHLASKSAAQEFALITWPSSVATDYSTFNNYTDKGRVSEAGQDLILTILDGDDFAGGPSTSAVLKVQYFEF